MADKNIKKSEKKKKKADLKDSANSTVLKTVVAQPELITKVKKGM